MSNIIDKIQVSGVTYDLVGGGGGGNPTVELTQAQYDALVTAGTVQADTYYIITDASAGDLSQYWTSAQTQNAINQATSGKQETLSAGTGIDITDNVISATGGGGGGKAIEAGTNISVTTGATADTINCTLPITGNTFGSVKIGMNANVPYGRYGALAWGGNYNSSSLNTASNFAQAGGYGCYAEDYSIAVGRDNSANTSFSVAMNGWNFTLNSYESAFGTGNRPTSATTTFGDSGNTIFTIGNGIGNGVTNLHNAFEVRQDGSIYIPDVNDTSTSNYYEKPMIKLQDSLGGNITIDSSLDSGSTNPVANSAITSGITAVENRLGGLSLVKLTESEYNALQNKDANTLYVIVSGGTPPTPQWVTYHIGETIPSGTYSGLRISSATTIDENASLTFQAGNGSTTLDVGNIICVDPQCSEYCCNEYDPETGECIDWSPDCCNEQCTSVNDGWRITDIDTGSYDEDGFTFTDGYWTFNDNVESYGDTATFDIELLS